MINNEQLLINFSGYNHSCICYIIGKLGEEIVDIYLKSRNNWILIGTLFHLIHMYR